MKLTLALGYFRGIDLSSKHNLIVPLYPPSTDAPRPWAVSSTRKSVDRILLQIPPVVRLLVAAVAIVSLLLWQFIVPSVTQLHIALVSS